MADFWPDQAAGTRPRHAAEPPAPLPSAPPRSAPPRSAQLPDPVAEPSRKFFLTRGGVIALVLLVVTAGVLVTYIRQAGTSREPAAAPAANTANTGSASPI